jgi:DNA (cytosine-5)-methyltransferase 1
MPSKAEQKPNNTSKNWKNEMQTTYTKVAVTKRGPRIWIEGKKLEASGFNIGATYRALYLPRTIVLTLAGNVQPWEHKKNLKKVSKRTRNGVDIPIIDILTSQIHDSFNDYDNIRVTFEAFQITIQLSNEQIKREDREARFKNAVIDREVATGSLFTGGAISTDAIHTALIDKGVATKTKWVVDQELKYLQVGEKNSIAITDDTAFIVGSIEAVDEELFTPVNIVSMSIPCAGFSRAGMAKHKQTSEEHSGTVLFGTLDAIRAANPAVIVSENVTEAKDSLIYVLLKGELERLGYDIFEQVLDSDHTGSIEQRRRYWFVAISNGLSEGFYLNLNRITAGQERRRIKDILQPIVPESAWADNQYLKDKAVRDAEDGKGFAKRQLLTGEETSIGTIGRYYNKRRSTEPFLTRSDGKERLLTPVEHARVKSVPEHLIDGVPTTTAHEVLGQGVDWLQPYRIVTKLMYFFQTRQWATANG